MVSPARFRRAKASSEYGSLPPRGSRFAPLTGAAEGALATPAGPSNGLDSTAGTVTTGWATTASPTAATGGVTRRTWPSLMELGLAILFQVTTSL